MKKIDGIWTNELYGTAGWESAGVLMLEGGRCLGGGNNHYSIGKYSESGRKVRIDVELIYFGLVRTLFGEKQRRVSVRLEGKRKKDTISGTLSRPGSKVLPLQFRLTRKSDLV